MLKQTVLAMSFLLVAPLAAYAATDDMQTSQQNRQDIEAPVEYRGKGWEVQENDSLLRRQSLTFKEITASDEMMLRGSNASAFVDFGSRSDEVVTAASIDLKYTYSPSLVGKVSHVKVYMNQELTAVIDIDPARSGLKLHKNITLDPRLFDDFNRLHFNFIGHYDDANCEVPVHSSLWFEISLASQLHVSYAPLTLGDDLSFFPAPFFDHTDFTRQPLPFVLTDFSSKAQTRAAAIVASWFGAQSKWRGTRFPVHHIEIPDQHSVVFATNDKRPQFLKEAPEYIGPTIQMASHPDFAHIKLLLITGRDDKDLVTAAQGLTLGYAALTGPSNFIESVDIAPRKPYDAPYLLPTDRPVKLVELVNSATDLEVTGYRPPGIRVNLQVPADLFTWHSQGIPMDLKFRYTPPVRTDESRLTVSINDKFVQAFNLQASGQGGHKDRVRVPLIFGSKEVLLPTFKLGTDNNIRFDYTFSSYTSSDCHNAMLFNTVGAIDENSTIDFSGFPHYAAMPNLSYFVNSAFPFTRMADLSDTAVILNTHTSTYELQAFLELMGKMGASTGYPALGVTIVRPDEMSTVSDKDLLFVGTMDQTDAHISWATDAPAIVQATANSVKNPRSPTDTDIERTGYLTNQNTETVSTVKIVNSGKLGALVGMASPLNANKSLVAVMAKSAGYLPDVVATITSPGEAKRIYGNVALISEGRIKSDLTGDTYYVGELPVWTLVWFHLSKHPSVIALLAVLSVLFVTFAAWRALKRISDRRIRSTGF